MHHLLLTATKRSSEEGGVEGGLQDAFEGNRKARGVGSKQPTTRCQCSASLDSISARQQPPAPVPEHEQETRDEDVRRPSWLWPMYSLGIAGL